MFIRLRELRFERRYEYGECRQFVANCRTKALHYNTDSLNSTVIILLLVRSINGLMQVNQNIQFSKLTGPSSSLRRRNESMRRNDRPISHKRNVIARPGYRFNDDDDDDQNFKEVKIKRFVQQLTTLICATGTRTNCRVERS